MLRILKRKEFLDGEISRLKERINEEKGLENTELLKEKEVRDHQSRIMKERRKQIGKLFNQHMNDVHPYAPIPIQRFVNAANDELHARTIGYQLRNGKGIFFPKYQLLDFEQSLLSYGSDQIIIQQPVGFRRSSYQYHDWIEKDPLTNTTSTTSTPNHMLHVNNSSINNKFNRKLEKKGSSKGRRSRLSSSSQNCYGGHNRVRRVLSNNDYLHNINERRRRGSFIRSAKEMRKIYNNRLNLSSMSFKQA